MRRREKGKKRGLTPEGSIALTFIAGIYLFDSVMKNRMWAVIPLTAYISFWIAANFGAKKTPRGQHGAKERNRFSL